MSALFRNFLSHDQKQNFIEAHSRNEVFCVHGLTDLKHEFCKINFLESFDSLIKKWTLDVDVHLADSRDEHTTLSLKNTKNAEAEFKKGQSLLFNDVDRQEGTLKDWLEEISTSLKLSSQAFSRCLVYATPKDGGNAPHFDQNINFILQLSGEKTWWTAPNTSVQNPMHRHVIGQEVEPELESCLNSPLPDTFPKDTQSFQLKAGSLLFVPPGVWHKTKAHTDAVSLNFTFSVPTFLELMQSLIRARLLGSELWREPAQSLEDPEQIKKFNFLIQHLGADLQKWDAEEVLRAFAHNM